MILCEGAVRAGQVGDRSKTLWATDDVASGEKGSDRIKKVGSGRA